MKRLAVISDLHADVRSLECALEQIDRMGCDEIVCLGDLVDHGHFPDETIALLIECRIPTLIGNHDAWAVGRGVSGDSFKNVASRNLDLSPQSVEFLRSIPRELYFTLEGERIYCGHGSPKSYMEVVLPHTHGVHTLSHWFTTLNADVILLGHSHVSMAILCSPNRLVANPGALLSEPPYGDDLPIIGGGPSYKASYGVFGVLTLPTKDFRVYRAIDGKEVNINRTIRC